MSIRLAIPTGTVAQELQGKYSRIFYRPAPTCLPHSVKDVHADHIIISAGKAVDVAVCRAKVGQLCKLKMANQQRRIVVAILPA